MGECIECGAVMTPGPGVCPSSGVRKLVVAVNETASVSETMAGSVLGQLSNSSLSKLAQSGKVPSLKVGRHWRFHKAAVDAWLSQDGGRERQARLVNQRSK